MPRTSAASTSTPVCTSHPEEDRDLEGYYEMFVFDPDGIRVEVACAPAGQPILSATNL